MGAVLSTQVAAVRPSWRSRTEQEGTLFYFLVSGAYMSVSSCLGPL